MGELSVPIKQAFLMYHSQGLSSRHLPNENDKEKVKTLITYHFTVFKHTIIYEYYQLRS